MDENENKVVDTQQTDTQPEQADCRKPAEPFFHIII